MKKTFIKLAFAFLVSSLVIISCGKRREASVTRVSDGVRLPLKMQSLTGNRDAYQTHAVLTFADSASTLVIDFSVEPGIPTRYLTGKYTWRGQTGPVFCSSVDFFGGQGEGPSLGASLSFSTSSDSSFSVFLPATPLQK